MSKTLKDYVTAHFVKHSDLRVKPRMVCADGFSLSVQAGEGLYCIPSYSETGDYRMVEVGYPERANGSGYRPASFGVASQWSGTVCGFVPIDVVNRWIRYHGGLKGEQA
jgi:hypothetical protein